MSGARTGIERASRNPGRGGLLGRRGIGGPGNPGIAPIGRYSAPAPGIGVGPKSSATRHAKAGAGSRRIRIRIPVTPGTGGKTPGDLEKLINVGVPGIGDVVAVGGHKVLVISTRVLVRLVGDRVGVSVLDVRMPGIANVNRVAMGGHLPDRHGV